MSGLQLNQVFHGMSRALQAVQKKLSRWHGLSREIESLLIRSLVFGLQANVSIMSLLEPLQALLPGC